MIEDKFNDFVKKLGISEQMLDNYITYSDRYYNVFYINKKNKKKKRIIEAPSQELKAIQKLILKEYLEKITVSEHANAFILGRGIKRNSLMHIKSRFFLIIDLKDFFLSISQKRIVNTLLNYFKDRRLVIKIAKLCTYKHRLPQGAASSPALSNIIFRDIDYKIEKYCKEHLIYYSRYADDMTFSCDNKNRLYELKKFLFPLLKSEGFRLNYKKIRFFSGKGRIRVTGVILNSGKPTVGKKLKRKIRATIFNFIVKKKSINMRKIAGYIAFIDSIENGYAKKIRRYINNLKKSFNDADKK